MKPFWVLVVCSAAMVTGCGTLLPKRVELFQDKVVKMPAPTAAERETLKEAALLATVRARETLVAAVSNQAPPQVVLPATDTVVLTEAMSRNVGPPLTPATNATETAVRLDTATARLDARLERFREKNDENQGKPIEGTGLVQVPYLVWLTGAGVVLFVLLFVGALLWGVLKVVALTNAPVALGLNAAQLAASTVRKGFAQVVQGGEQFKEAVRAEFGDEAIARRVLELFRREQQKAQDADVQQVIQHLTR